MRVRLLCLPLRVVVRGFVARLDLIGRGFNGRFHDGLHGLRVTREPCRLHSVENVGRAVSTGRLRRARKYRGDCDDAAALRQSLQDLIKRLIKRGLDIDIRGQVETERKLRLADFALVVRNRRHGDKLPLSCGSA